MGWVKVSPVSELKAGEYKVVDVDDTLVAVCNIDNKFYAIEDVCSHDGATLSGLPMEGDEIICPRHGARFCVKNGKALTPPAYQDIDCFPVEIRDDNIYVRDDRWD